VALDDFGTGYSSLSYLRRFPIDALKIDQSFVNHIDAAAGDASIVTAVISMARSFNLRVVAEGVETPEQLAFLQVHRCDRAQGYVFSKPVQPQNFAKLLRRKTPPLSLLPARSSRFGDLPASAAQVRRVAGACRGAPGGWASASRAPAPRTPLVASPGPTLRSGNKIELWSRHEGRRSIDR
jgi:hypothetical protein